MSNSFLSFFSFRTFDPIYESSFCHFFDSCNCMMKSLTRYPIIGAPFFKGTTIIDIMVSKAYLPKVNLVRFSIVQADTTL